MLKKHLISAIIIIIGAACQDKYSSRGVTPEIAAVNNQPEDYIPPIVKKEEDPSFGFIQDTLNYLGKKFDGYVMKQFANGDTASFAGYVKGLQQGVAKKWYAPSVIQEVRYFNQGKKTGVHTGNWETGEPKFEYHFENGEHEGVLKEWYQNGQPYKIFHYKKGYEEGSQKMWWENGVIRANYVVKNGRRFGLVGLKLCMNPK